VSGPALGFEFFDRPEIFFSSLALFFASCLTKPLNRVFLVPRAVSYTVSSFAPCPGGTAGSSYHLDKIFPFLSFSGSCAPPLGCLLARAAVRFATSGFLKSYALPLPLPFESRTPSSINQIRLFFPPARVFPRFFFPVPVLFPFSCSFQ